MRNTAIRLSYESIVQAVANDFPNFNPQFFGNKSFEEVASKALGANPFIVSFKSDKRESNVKIIIEFPFSPPSGSSVFTLIRFFPLGEKWETSIDVQKGEAGNIFDWLLDVDYNDGE